MRITYTKKSKKLRDQTLQQIRKLRQRFEAEHPELLQKIRDEVKNQPLYDNHQSGSEKVETCSEDIQEIPIDRKKNLMTISTLLQSHKGSDHFQAKLQDILLEIAKTTKN